MNAEGSDEAGGRNDGDAAWRLMMGYYNDYDSDDYVNLAASAVVLSPEEKARIRAEIDNEAEELRAELESRVAAEAAEAATFRATYEAKLYKEVAFVAFNRDDEWRSLADQGYVDKEYASVWLGYWAELRSAEDVRRVIRVGGDLVKAWMSSLVKKVEALPHFEAMRKGVEKLEASVADSIARIEKRCEQYVESRLSFHGLR